LILFLFVSVALCQRARLGSNLFDCSNGVYDGPLVEECDIEIDPVNCLPACYCRLPFVSDTKGGCSSCGNGFLEPQFGEICDMLTNTGCNTTCNGCKSGFGWNPTLKICSICGNGVLDNTEDCDAALDDNCDWSSCTCGGLAPDGQGRCGTCGNSQHEFGEVCDSADINCLRDCSGCTPPYYPTFRFGCSLCGNFQVDADEVCDSSDYNCDSSCDFCVEFHIPDETGHCTRCGNGLLDKGEVCDTAGRSGCNGDCQSCGNGLVPLLDKYGTCSTCGNAKVESDEACDPGLDVECFGDCSACSHPSISIGRRCVTCGNGIRDVIYDDDDNVISSEICDSSQPGCADDCKACDDGWVPALDETGTCVPECAACCEELKARLGEGEGDAAGANALVLSITVFLSGFLAALY